MLEQGEIINLSNDKEYVVVSSISYLDKNYVYILDTDTYKDFKFCVFEDNKVKVVKDPELMKTLIAKFNTDLKDNLADIIHDVQ